MKGYQYLKNEFFSTCKTRKISGIPMLLYIYLRGLYCRFQISSFFCKDSMIIDELGISPKTLQRARLRLQEAGLILFTSGRGRDATTYQMLGTVLLPTLTTQSGHAMRGESGHIDHSYIRVKNKVKNKNRIGTTAQELLEKYKKAY